MKIYDCFSYLDEDLLLEIRLNILDKYVDYFVIVEGNKTWQNNNKKLRFDIKKFENFKNKIIYVPVNDMPDGENPWVRENFQRNCISRGLLNSSPEDIIIDDAGCEPTQREPQDGDEWRIERQWDSPKNEKFLQDQNDLQWQQQQEHNIDD